MDWIEKLAKDQAKKLKKILSSEWNIGFRDRGMGHGDFGVVVKKTSELVVECPSREIALHIIELHNASRTKKPRR